jgi:hypothetical protein
MLDAPLTTLCAVPVVICTPHTTQLLGVPYSATVSPPPSLIIRQVRAPRCLEPLSPTPLPLSPAELLLHHCARQPDQSPLCAST